MAVAMGIIATVPVVMRWEVRIMDVFLQIMAGMILAALLIVLVVVISLAIFSSRIRNIRKGLEEDNHEC